MSDLIDRHAAIVAIEAHLHGVLDVEHYEEGIAFGYEAAHRHIQDVINVLPSAEPVRMKGKWIPIQRGFFNKDVTQVKCGQCGNLLDLIGVNCGRGDANFCPNCGACMSEGETDD